MTPVRQFSRELEEEERRELTAVLRQCVLTPGDGEDEVDLGAVGIRVHALQRGDHYLYTVSEVLVADLKNYIREGHVLLKAGDTLVTSFPPHELHQFCHTRLTSSCVRLVFGSKDTLRVDAEACCDDVDYVALKVGLETVEKREEGCSVGCVPTRRCCTSPLDNPSTRTCVVKLDSSYLKPEPGDLKLHRSHSSHEFENQCGFLEEETSILVGTLETWVHGRRMALRYDDQPNQNDCLSLELATPPRLDNWPFNINNEGRRVIKGDCNFLFCMIESSSRRFELRPLHHKEFFLCLNDGGVLVGKRTGDSADIFDILPINSNLPDLRPVSVTELSPCLDISSMSLHSLDDSSSSSGSGSRETNLVFEDEAFTLGSTPGRNSSTTIMPIRTFLR